MVVAIISCGAGPVNGNRDDRCDPGGTMPDEVNLPGTQGAGGTQLSGPTRFLLGRFARQFADSAVSFEVVLPDGSLHGFGPGQSSFRITIRNRTGLRAL